MDQLIVDGFTWLSSNANGINESIILFWLVILDTILGSLWRSNWEIRKLSKGAIKGILTNVSLSLMPVLIFVSGAFAARIKVGAAYQASMANRAMFDFMSTTIALIAGWWLLKSIIANWQLSGHDLPISIAKWVHDEALDKLERNNVEDAAAGLEKLTRK